MDVHFEMAMDRERRARKEQKRLGRFARQSMPGQQKDTSTHITSDGKIVGYLNRRKGGWQIIDVTEPMGREVGMEKDHIDAVRVATKYWRGK